MQKYKCRKKHINMCKICFIINSLLQKMLFKKNDFLLKCNNSYLCLFKLRPEMNIYMVNEAFLCF